MTDTSQAATLINVESLIKSYYQKFNSITLESRQAKDMLQGVLDNDPEYNQSDLDAKKATKLKTIAKQKLMNSASNADLADKVKDYQQQLRELKNGLSDYLTQYVNLSGTNKIETVDGALLEIVTQAKLVKKKE